MGKKKRKQVSILLAVEFIQIASACLAGDLGLAPKLE